MRYTVKDPQGQMHIIEGPEGATPDEVIAQAQKLIPAKEKPVDWRGVIKSAMGNALMRPGSSTRNLASDPITQAQALPELAGTVGAISPIPGGATMGTVGGRQLSNLALKTYGRSDLIPSGGQQLAEGALSAFGDVAAIPGIKKYALGKQIGKIEKAAGVPEAHEIPSIPMTAGQKSLGEFINDAVASVKSAGGKGQPAYWKQIKDQVDRIYKMGKDEALTTLDKGRLKWLSNKVQDGLNNSVIGREIPAKALAKSQTIPRYISAGYKMIPQQFRRGAAYGAGAGAAGLTAYDLIKKLSGG